MAWSKPCRGRMSCSVGCHLESRDSSKREGDIRVAWFLFNVYIWLCQLITPSLPLVRPLSCYFRHYFIWSCLDHLLVQEYFPGFNPARCRELRTIFLLTCNNLKLNRLVLIILRSSASHPGHTRLKIHRLWQKPACPGHIRIYEYRTARRSTRGFVSKFY